MRRLVLACLAACAAACPDEPAPPPDAAPPRADVDPASWPRYASDDLALRLRHPAGWRVERARAGEPLEVLNVRPNALPEDVDLPLTVHAPATVGYVAVFPAGYGTELPAGRRTPLGEADVALDPSLPVDREAAQVLLLEDGTPWAYLLPLERAPPGWSKEAFVFAHLPVMGFEARCYDDETGRELSMEECDPLAGDDFRRTGRVPDATRRTILGILESLRFEAGTSEPTEQIEVARPEAGARIRSPLLVRGRARGPWYHEGRFSIRLVADGRREVARGVAEAKGEWTTEDWVPFEAELSFEAPDAAKHGTLLLDKANPSGRPEHDRARRVPVRFAP